MAGFIGSPSMNFLPASVADGKLRTALGDLPMGDRIRRRLEAGEAPRDLILGIRPEHFEDASLVAAEAREHGAEFDSTVELVESMGSDKYVYLPLEGDRATAADLEELAADAGAADLPKGDTGLVTRFSAESRVRADQPARVWLNLQKIHLFDPADGRNVTLDEGRAAPSS